MNRGLDLIGRQIGVYRVEELIGAGGYSRVYRGLDKTVGRQAAIKMLLPAAGEDGYSDLVIQRFEREARIVANLRDPHSVLLYEYGQTDDGLLYLIFEFIEGHTLEEIRRQQFGLPTLRVVKILEQILLSLEEAHALGLIHRDIKPANIMVFEHIGRTDQVKVLDFGVGKAYGARADEQDLTQTGMLIGTPRYMAPEQWSSDGNISPQTDIYSLGLVVYELLTGTRAITADDPVHIMKAHLDRHPIELPAELDIPSGLRQVVNTMLVKSPDERYHCVTQVLADLLRLKPPGADSNTMLLDEVKLRGTADSVKRSRATNDEAPQPSKDHTKPGAPGELQGPDADEQTSPDHQIAPKPRVKSIRLQTSAETTHTSDRPKPEGQAIPPVTPKASNISRERPPKTPVWLLACLGVISFLIGGFALYRGLSSKLSRPTSALEQQAASQPTRSEPPSSTSSPSETRSSKSSTSRPTPSKSPQEKIFAAAADEPSVPPAATAPKPAAPAPAPRTDKPNPKNADPAAPASSAVSENTDSKPSPEAKKTDMRARQPAKSAKKPRPKTNPNRNTPPNRPKQPVQKPKLKIWGIE